MNSAREIWSTDFVTPPNRPAFGAGKNSGAGRCCLVGRESTREGGWSMVQGIWSTVSVADSRN